MSLINGVEVGPGFCSTQEIVFARHDVGIIDPFYNKDDILIQTH